MTIDEFNINNKNHILIVRKVIQMLTLVPESLALYPLEKHFQRENETGQPGYANISCRGAMPATNLDRTLGRTLFFFLILNLGSSGVVERPKIGPGTLRRPVPMAVSRPPALAPSCKGDVFSSDPVCFPCFQFLSPFLEAVPMARVALQLVKVVLGLLENNRICTRAACSSLSLSVCVCVCVLQSSGLAEV